MMEMLNSSTGYIVENAIDSEIRIRVWWALFMADNWCSSSLGLPRQMKDSTRPDRLPVDEHLFASLAPESPCSMVQGCRIPGLWAHMVTLVELFPLIQDLNRRVVHERQLSQTQLEHDTNQLAQRLELGRGTGGPFLALHLGFHHYATLLYYQYLDTAFIQTTQSRLFAARCKHHALGYSTLLARGRQQPGCEAVYPTTTSSSSGEKDTSSFDHFSHHDANHPSISLSPLLSPLAHACVTPPPTPEPFSTFTNNAAFFPADNYSSWRTIYGRTLQLPDGSFLMTWEDYPPEPPQVAFPIYRSTDGGATWSEYSRVEDTVDGWGLRYQPFLYTLETAWGEYDAGTILISGASVPADLSEAFLDIYASRDAGLTWEFVSHIAYGAGPETVTNGNDAIWEPSFIPYGDQLICFYSDQRDPAHGQKMVAVTTSDLKS
ncbi:hypothetical protein N7449_003492 [Penicillium cf. viridicatum]|uniref:Xylanolytic transcriptional activator regulatory domain-containing protein n=1 Tax=Penicillium cf. viridicatum TaxID=2972119 RepID=A0A9W9MX17_9EURO|nr:hypothetical protein N7449_003492 [Penicillium cf. viridicatum]